MIQQFIQWCYTAHFLEVLRNGKYSIPVLQSFHLAGITAVLGVVCILALRLLGIGMLKISLRTLYRELSGWFLAFLIITLVSGFIIAIIDPTRYLANTSFRVKMACLAASILFHYTIFRSVVRNAPDEETPRTTPSLAVLGCVSLVLWFSVGWAGRFIAFLG